MLKHRSPAAVLLLPLVTLGIYSIVWYVKTRGELNAAGASIATTWWIIVPFGAFYYLWSFGGGAQKVAGLSQGATFALLLLLGSIGQTIVQSQLNSSQAAAK
jgi:hypothetical protein